MSQTFTPNVDDSDEDDKTDENNGIPTKKKGKQNNKGSSLFGRCSYRKAKKVVVSPFKKFQKLFKNPKSSSSSSSSSNSLLIPVMSSSISNSSGVTRSGNCCCSCLCMSKPQTLGVDFEGIDPNDSNVSCEYIKSLIENNDFYSKECNTHFSD